MLSCVRRIYKNDINVRDHDHRTGNCRGAADQTCNIDYFKSRYLPYVRNIK